MIRRRRRDTELPAGGAGSHPANELDTHEVRMLASAIAGRPVAVSADSTGVAHTDGSTIHIGPSDSVTTVCLQAALVGAGSLETQPLKRVLGRRAVMSRYITLEVDRAVTSLTWLMPPSVSAEVAARRTFAPTGSPTESAERAVRDRSVPEAPAMFGTLRRGALSGAIDTSLGQGDEADSADAEKEGDNDIERSSLLVAARFDNAFTKLMRDIITPAVDPSEEEDSGGIEMAVTSAASGSRQGKGIIPTLARLSKFTAAPPDPRGHHYPEWDFRANAYRADHCTVTEYDPAAREDVEPLHVTPSRELTRAALRVTTVREPHNRQMYGDALDLSSLVRFEISSRAGQTPDERVMRARLRTANELSVMLLIDCSGSGAESAAGRAIWEHQRQVGAQMLAAFDAAGARVAAYGFNSRGRTVQFLRIKSFAGRYGSAARERLATLQPSGYTRMGAAIRHATTMLEKNGGSDRRLLIVVSDGLPYDDDYEGAYAEHDARQALQEAAARGIGCACFTVESPTEHSTLERLWGSATYVQLVSGRRWAQPVEATLHAAMRQASSTQKPRTAETLGATA